MPKVYLLSRTLDPLLGLFTGLLAYHLHETNPRSSPPVGHTLRELLAWKWGAARERRAMVDNAAEADTVEWDRVRRELENEGKK